MNNNNKVLDKEYLESLDKNQLIELLLKKEEVKDEKENKGNDHQNKGNNNGGKKEKKKKGADSIDFDKYSKRFIALRVAYLGWHYHGFAAQNCTEETIEGHLIKALQKTCLIKDIKNSNYTKSGRTDKGVSAFGQVISLYVRSNLKSGDGIIPAISPPDLEKEQEKLKKKKGGDQSTKVVEYPFVKMLNGVLPPFIRVLAWTPVPFHFSARFSTLYRTYKYYFNPTGLDIEEMKLAARSYIGTHDFTNFCKIDLEATKTFVRHIISLDIAPVPVTEFSNGGLYEVTISGFAFLWHQIRCMMAMLFLIGQGKYKYTIIQELLDTSKANIKPIYEMASEIPLVLYDCGYEDIEFIYDHESHKKLISSLFTTWNQHYIKSAVSSLMLTNLNQMTFPNNVDNQSNNSNNNNNNNSNGSTKNKQPQSMQERLNQLGPKRLKLYQQQFGDTTSNSISSSSSSTSTTTTSSTSSSSSDNSSNITIDQMQDDN